MKRRSQADYQAAYNRAARAAKIQAQAAWMRRQGIPGAPTAEQAREMARYPGSRSSRRLRAQRKRSGG